MLLTSYIQEEFDKERKKGRRTPVRVGSQLIKVRVKYAQRVGH